MSLDPYSNGMKIEHNYAYTSVIGFGGLDPYSNGMKIEPLKIT